MIKMKRFPKPLESKVKQKQKEEEKNTPSAKSLMQ